MTSDGRISRYPSPSSLSRRFPNRRPARRDGSATTWSASPTSASAPSVPESPENVTQASRGFDPALALHVEEMEMVELGRQADPRAFPRRLVGRLLAHDHHLPVLEPADHVAFMTQRRDHRDRGWQETV